MSSSLSTLVDDLGTHVQLQNCFETCWAGMSYQQRKHSFVAAFEQICKPGPQPKVRVQAAPLVAQIHEALQA